MSLGPIPLCTDVLSVKSMHSSSAASCMWCCRRCRDSRALGLPRCAATAVRLRATASPGGGRFGACWNTTPRSSTASQNTSCWCGMCTGTRDVDVLLALFFVVLRRTTPKALLLKCAWDRCRWAGGSSSLVAGVTGTRTGRSCATFSASPCPRCPSQPPSPRTFR